MIWLVAVAFACSFQLQPLECSRLPRQRHPADAEGLDAYLKGLAIDSDALPQDSNQGRHLLTADSCRRGAIDYAVSGSPFLTSSILFDPIQAGAYTEAVVMFIIDHETCRGDQILVQLSDGFIFDPPPGSSVDPEFLDTGTDGQYSKYSGAWDETATRLIFTYIDSSPTPAMHRQYISLSSSSGLRLPTAGLSSNVSSIRIAIAQGTQSTTTSSLYPFVTTQAAVLVSNVSVHMASADALSDIFPPFPFQSWWCSNFSCSSCSEWHGMKNACGGVCPDASVNQHQRDALCQQWRNRNQTSAPPVADVTCSGSCSCNSSTGQSSGSITDGSGDYSNGEDCRWLISSTSEIRLFFHTFHTVSNYDWVTINRCSSSSCSSSSYDELDKVEIAKLSGSPSTGISLSNEYTSSTGYLQVLFTSHSGSAITCSGSCACSPSSGQSSGTITDGSEDYSNGEDCRWLISSPSEIRLSFTSFSTESGYDYVTINRCTSSSCSSTEQIARLSGSGTNVTSLSNVYTSSTGYLQVLFTSDGSATMSGFAATWNTVLSGRSGFVANWSISVPEQATTPTLNCFAATTVVPSACDEFLKYCGAEDGACPIREGALVSSSAAAAAFVQAIVAAEPGFSGYGRSILRPVSASRALLQLDLSLNLELVNDDLVYVHLPGFYCSPCNSSYTSGENVPMMNGFSLSFITCRSRLAPSRLALILFRYTAVHHPHSPTHPSDP